MKKKHKRFSIKDFRKWLYETAMEAKDNNSFKDGTCYVNNLGGGVSAVICWSEDSDFEFEEDNPFMRKAGKRMCCGREITEAYCLEVSLRETEPLSAWGNSPADWLYWDTHLPGAEENGLEGSLSFSQANIDDKMKSYAHYLSSERTQFLKYNKFYV